jgi:ABC-2 type transport system permease protein
MNALRKVGAIGFTNTRRFLREKGNLFFVFVFPVLIVLVIGSFYAGGFDARLGVHAAGSGPLAEDLVTALDGIEGVEVRRYGTEAALLEGVQRGAVRGGLAIPDGFDTEVAAGRPVQVGFVARPDQAAALLQQSVVAVVQEQSNRARAALLAESLGAGGFGDALAVAGAVAPASKRVEVAYREAGDYSLLAEFQGMGAFDMGAHQQLVLFVFLTSLAGSAALIQTRQLGLARRMLSTPTSVSVILAGETLGRLNVALIQGLYIAGGTLLLFRVDWGDPLGAAALLVVFGLVGAAAGILMGALFSNDQQASSLGVLFGLGLAALGGAMVPIEIFPPAMQSIARFTPHAWAIDGFAEMVRRGGGFVDVIPNLGVLLLFAAVLMAAGTWRLRRVLTR